MPSLRQQIRDLYDSHRLSDAKMDAILRGTGVHPAGSVEQVSRLPLAGPGETPAPRLAGRAPVLRTYRRLALAAAVLLFAVLAFQFAVRRPAQVSFTAVAPRIVEFFRGPHPLNPSQNPAELRAWLLANGAPADLEYPAKLAALKSVGCNVVEVQGKRAFLTCFWREPELGEPGRELIHLLAVRRSDFRDAPVGSAPELRELEGWSFASWTAGDVIYTMATPAPMEKLRLFLAGWKTPSPKHQRSSKLQAAGNPADTVAPSRLEARCFLGAWDLGFSRA